MINPNIFAIAVAHADALKEVCNQAIVPAGNSVMSMLMNDSYMLSGSTGDSKTAADFLAAVTADDLDGPSDHSTVMGARIDSLIPLVASHIDYVQNVVTPQVRKFDETMCEAVTKLDAMSPMQEFNIVQKAAPELVSDEDFMALVDRFATDIDAIPARLSMLPAQSPEQLYTAMRVTSARVNAAMGRWIATLGDDWFLDLWSNYFASDTTVPINGQNQFSSNYANISGLPTLDRLNVATALFLLARGYMDSPIEGANMSLDSWTGTLDNISRFAGAQIKAAMFHADMMTRQGFVVLNVSDNGKQITVNTPFYIQFLEAGGDEAILLGATMSSNAKTITLSTLLDKDANFAEVWRNYQAMNQSTLNARATISLRSVANSAFAASLGSITDEEQLTLSVSRKSPDTLRAEATAAIEAMTLNELRDTRSLALCLIGGIRYCHTPAKQILQDMHEAEQAGCESPQEAALIAATNYVADSQAFELALVPA